MSCSSLSGKPIGIPDDLESFFHVLLWHALKYLPHNCLNVGDFTTTFFDGFYHVDGAYLCGHHKKLSMQQGMLLVGRNEVPLFFSTAQGSQENHPLNKVIHQALRILKTRYASQYGLDISELLRDPDFSQVSSAVGSRIAVTDANASPTPRSSCRAHKWWLSFENACVSF